MHASGAAATVLINPSGTVAGWSQGAQILLGWSAEEAVSRSADELFGVGFSRALSRVLDEELNPVRLTVQAKNGTVVNAELTAHPCEDRGGRPLGAFLTVSGGGPASVSCMQCTTLSPATARWPPPAIRCPSSSRPMAA
ncbi:PAS domain-containing protein [Streptomyces luteolifulvus]|uniref:PAS domain-containing protein n=1 Tax=Streptomyces luteolifulvus TaxID=2615112 RepID=A0A6H9UR71_9ACTN|nr:PAS domain-containing protein [Streptomyces luteolifulvus]